MVNLPQKKELMLSLLLVSALQCQCIKLTAENISGYLTRNATHPFQDQQLTEIEPGALEVVQRDSLDFEHNDIITLPENLFEFNDRFKYLSFQFNLILGTNVHPQVLQRLANLTEIDLSYNILNLINEDLFKHNYQMKKLFLQYNRISSIHPKAFVNLLDLRVLHLAGNKLEVIESEWFESNEKLERLLLYSNRIRTISPVAFRSLIGLETLYISDNCLKTLDLDLFATTKSLFSLFIGKNKLMEIDYNKIPTYFPDLDTISLGNNLLNCSHATLLTKYLDAMDVKVFPKISHVSCISDARYSRILRERTGYPFRSILVERINNLQRNFTTKWESLRRLAMKRNEQINYSLFIKRWLSQLQIDLEDTFASIDRISNHSLIISESIATTSDVIATDLPIPEDP